MLAVVLAAVEEVPEFGALVLGIPLAKVVAVRLRFYLDGAIATSGALYLRRVAIR